jgi:acyl dehydratase
MSSVPHPQPYDVVAVNLDPQADNRIHDDEVAQRYGFTGALVPGVEVFALATVPYLRSWGEAFLAGGRLALRFRKPVYDGERVTVTPVDRQLTVRGPDGVTRATGAASAPGEPSPPGSYDARPLPPQPMGAPQLGDFGTVRQQADPWACADYVRRIGDDHPLYGSVVHPGLLLRLVNLALMSNVALGPWIHTSSDCRFLGLARVDEDLEVRSRVTELFERRGHRYVRYDALVLAGGRPVAEVDHEAIWRLAGHDEPGSTQA